MTRFRLISVLVLGIGAAVMPISASATEPEHIGERAVCSVAPVGWARCHAHVEDHADTGAPLATVSWSAGYQPSDLQAAYNLPGAASGVAGSGPTVAVVDAYDNPNAASDLRAYRRQFNLPLCASGGVECLFKKVNQNGQATPRPATNVGWGQEIDLDLQMVSAACPLCKIVLVEANNNSFANLTTAVDTAARMATVISNSYGGSEFAGEGTATYNGHYNHPGVAITVSSGDNGFGVEFPAASQYVTAVGGTSLRRSTTAARGWTETAWSGAGSGCSAYIPRPAWQPVVGTCTKRTVADVSAVADPNTGVAVYDSFGSSNGANWYVFGGTSVSAPLIAGIYGVAGNATTVNYGQFPYLNPASLFDVTSGSNGQCATANRALCTAGVGYDGPTGLGTPNGPSGF